MILSRSVEQIASARMSLQSVVEQVGRAVEAGLFTSPTQSLDELRTGMHGLSNLAQIAEAERWLRKCRACRTRAAMEGSRYCAPCDDKVREMVDEH